MVWVLGWGVSWLEERLVDHIIVVVVVVAPPRWQINSSCAVWVMY